MNDATPSTRLFWGLLASVGALLAVITVVSVAVLLVPGGPEVSDDRVSALWILLASLLATAASLVGALLSKTSQERSHALQAQTEERKGRLESEAEQRMRLEATVNGLELLRGDERPDTVVTAGALAAIVELGHPIIALRVLSAALDVGAVDPATAAWVLDRVFAKPLGTMSGPAGPPGDLGQQYPEAVRQARHEAAAVLHRHSGVFPRRDLPGGFDWPDCFRGRWLAGLDTNGGSLVVHALVDTILSAPRSWWTDGDGTWIWVVDSLDAALGCESDPDILLKAAAHLALLLDLAGPDDYVPYRSEIVSRAEAYGGTVGPPARLDRIRRWGAGADVSDETRAAIATDPAEAAPGTTGVQHAAATAPEEP